jgi:hypothetical protein
VRITFAYFSSKIIWIQADLRGSFWPYGNSGWQQPYPPHEAWGRGWGMIPLLASLICWEGYVIYVNQSSGFIKWD